SHLYHLRTTAQARPAITGAHADPLYTADTRAAITRPYRCAGCGAVHQVGPGARWRTIAQLKADGCPDCHGTVLRPMALGGAGGGGGAWVGGAPRPAGTPGVRIRPAGEEDLDVIAGFEIEIARASFGHDAIEDPALHRKRVAGALGKPGEVTLVAVTAGAP